MTKKRFTVGDYIEAIRLFCTNPKVQESVLRRAREDSNISLQDYALILRAADEIKEVE